MSEQDAVDTFRCRLSRIMPAADLPALSDDDVIEWLGVFRGAWDRLLNESERRGLIFADDGRLVIQEDIPEACMVETILTRELGEAEMFRDGYTSQSRH